MPIKMLKIPEHTFSRGDAHLLEDFVDVDLEGLNLAFALLSLASCDLLGHLLSGLLLCLGSHCVRCLCLQGAVYGDVNGLLLRFCFADV